MQGVEPRPTPTLLFPASWAALLTAIHLAACCAAGREAAAHPCHPHLVLISECNMLQGINWPQIRPCAVQGVKPRPTPATSIPGLLSLFQNVSSSCLSFFSVGLVGHSVACSRCSRM